VALEARVTPSVLFVDDDKQQKPNAQFTSIQAAVTAAQPGDTIKVFAGTYQAVNIPTGKNGLDIEGVGNRDKVIVNGSASAPAFHVAGAKNVDIEGFRINGDGAEFGVVVDQGGSASVEGNHVTSTSGQKLTGAFVGVQFGRTDGAGNLLSAGSGDATDNLIDSYRKGGVVVIGTGSNADVVRNTVRGAGPTDVIAQNGIQVSDGATGTVSGNTVSGNKYTKEDAEGTGIIVFQSNGVRIRNNFAFGNDEGILLDTSNNSTVSGNTSNGNTFNGVGVLNSNNNQIENNRTFFNGFDGINLETSNNNTVNGNEAAFNGRYGIALEADTTGNTVRNNRLHDNAAGDLNDLGTGNHVSNNQIGRGGEHGHHGHHDNDRPDHHGDDDHDD